MSFDTNVGLALQNAFANGNASHAYIVVAEKQSVAQLLKECAQVVLCPNHRDDGCETCHKVIVNEHQDVISLPTDTVKNRLTVADVNYMIEESYKRPVDLSSTGRVFLLNATDSVAGIGSEIWQNKLLKTLEEPTDNVYVFVGVTDLESLLPTVRSRCQVLKQAKYNTDEIITVLKNKGYDLRTCQICASTSGGSMSVAERTATNSQIFTAYDVAMDVVENMSSTKVALKYVSDILSCGENITDCLGFVCTLLNESILYRLAPQLCVLSSLKSTVGKVCQNYSLQSAEVCIEKINLAKKHLDEGSNLQVTVDNLVNDILEVKYRCRQ